MSTLGSFAKGLAFVLGKQPEDEQRPHGFLGLEWVERADAGRTEVVVSSRAQATLRPQAAGFSPATES